MTAEADDRPLGDGRHDARVAPRLAGVGVRQVQLDDGTVERGQRVVDAPRVVRERAGIDDDRRAPPAGAVDGVDELTLVVALERLDGQAVLGEQPARPSPRGRPSSPCRRSPAPGRRAGSGSARAAPARSVVHRPPATVRPSHRASCSEFGAGHPHVLAALLGGVRRDGGGEAVEDVAAQLGEARGWSKSASGRGSCRASP